MAVDPFARKEVQERKVQMGKLFKRGKKWGISYTDPDGRQVRKVVSPYRETAETILKKIEVQIVEGKYLDIKKEKHVLFEDLAREYINTYVRQENAKSFYHHACLVNRLKGHFRQKCLHQINTLTIRQYISSRLEEVKPSTVNRDLTMLKSMFNRAIEWGMFLGKNPAVGIKKMAENNTRCRFLTSQEQVSLLSHCKGVTKVIVITALQTGMRWGEIASLKWRPSPNSNYVDFELGMIFIHESLTKTKKSRKIPLSNSVRLALRDLSRDHGNDYIFFNPETKKPFGSIKNSYKAALNKAGIQDFRFHDLRHTFASDLIAQGVDLYAVQKLLGHSTPMMTQRYAHLKEDHLKDAIKKIDIQLDKLLYNSNFNIDSTDLAQTGCGQNKILPQLT